MALTSIYRAIVTFLVLAAFQVHAIPVTYDGVDYDVTAQAISYEGNEALFEGQVWWGNMLVADAFAIEVGDGLDFGATDTLFAYSLHTGNGEDFTQSRYYDGGSTYNGFSPVTHGGWYAFAAPVDAQVPEPSMVLLMASGLMVFGIVRRKPRA